MALRSPLRGWPAWQLPRSLAACVTAVIAASSCTQAPGFRMPASRPLPLARTNVLLG